MVFSPENIRFLSIVSGGSGYTCTGNGVNNPPAVHLGINIRTNELGLQFKLTYVTVISSDPCEQRTSILSTSRWFLTCKCDPSLCFLGSARDPVWRGVALREAWEERTLLGGNDLNWGWGGGGHSNVPCVSMATGL